MEKNGINFDLQGIGAMFSTADHFSVPLYQRSYSWEEEQVAEYFSDLNSALSTDEPGYFLGTIVLTRKNSGSGDSYEIIDGQQRLSTTALLLIAIRNIYKEKECNDDASKLEELFLFKHDFVTSDSVPKMSMNSDDNNLFQKMIKYSVVDKPDGIKRSEDLMWQAEELLKRSMDSCVADEGGRWKVYLGKWINFVEKNVSVVQIVARDESDAYLIFETLNDRGADLTISDLLKNYLLGKSENRIDEVRDKWMQSVGAIDLASDKPVFTSFLRQFWSSKHGTTRERALYKDIKENITTAQQAVSLTNEMAQAAQYYGLKNF